MLGRPSSLPWVISVAAALIAAGCFLDRGGIDPGGQMRDAGSPPDGQTMQGDAHVDGGHDSGTPCVPSGPELCDGIDNDCDSATADGADESTLGDACDDPEDADLCAGGAIACTGGALACAGDDGDQPGEVELCDGLDNDCNPDTADGSGEPGLLAACDDAADADSCMDGMQLCVDGALVCTGDDGDQPDEIELCDGIDNDCDPTTADGAAEAWVGTACDDGVDLDLCVGGTYACVSGAMACTGDDGDRPSEVELCDNIDNDCNPATVDGASDPALGTPCDDPGDADACLEGVRTCVGGVLVCTGDDGDQPDEVELCDGIDNDCNPLTLDGAAETLGGRCDGPDADLCREGMITGCSGGVLTCTDATGDNPEICNGLDDDCDGTVDEGTTCPGCTRVARGAASYLFCVATVSWTDARDACRAVGASPTSVEGGYELVSIGEAAEQTFVATTAGGLSTSGWWIGLNDRGTEGSYTWVADDSALGSYQPWESGQPNDGWVLADQDCIALEPTEGWNDYGCGATVSYVCEASP